MDQDKRPSYEEVCRIVGELYLTSHQSAQATKRYLEVLEKENQKLVKERDDALAMLKELRNAPRTA